MICKGLISYNLAGSCALKPFSCPTIGFYFGHFQTSVCISRHWFQAISHQGVGFIEHSIPEPLHPYAKSV
jgi:hypothetical protein